MFRLLTPALSLSLALGCSASPPDEGPVGPDAGPGGDDVRPGDGEPRLRVDEVRESTPFFSIPISGEGPANGTLIVDTPMDSLAGDIGSDGRFCIDVALQPSTSNTLWLRALDERGVYSEEVELTVRQEGELPVGENEIEEGPEFRNVARLGELQSSHAVETGELAYVNDGDHSTYARLENNPWGADWLIVELTEEAPVHHLRVHGTEECPLLEYLVWLTDAPNPERDQPIWSPIGQVETQLADHQVTMPWDTEPNVTAVMIETTGWGCGTFVGNHEIYEIEVLSRPETSENPAPEGPTCAGGSPDLP